MTGFSSIRFTGTPGAPIPSALSLYGADHASGVLLPPYVRTLAQEDVLTGLQAYEPRQAMYSQSWAGEHDFSPVARMYATPRMLNEGFRAVRSPKGMRRKIGHALQRLKALQRDASQPSILLVGEVHQSATSQRALREVMQQVPAGSPFHMEFDLPTMADLQDRVRAETGDVQPTLAQRAQQWDEAFAQPMFLPGRILNHERAWGLGRTRFLELMDYGLEHVRPVDPKRAAAAERYGVFNHAGMADMREQGMLDSLRKSGPFGVAVVGATHVARLGARLRAEGFNVQEISFVPLGTDVDDQVSQFLRTTRRRVGVTGRTYVVPDANRFPAYDRPAAPDDRAQP